MCYYQKQQNLTTMLQMSGSSIFVGFKLYANKGVPDIDFPLGTDLITDLKSYTTNNRKHRIQVGRQTHNNTQMSKQIPSASELSPLAVPELLPSLEPMLGDVDEWQVAPTRCTEQKIPTMNLRSFTKLDQTELLG